MPHSSSTRTPPLLQPYLTLPRSESIFLLTSILGASANWLTVRFLCEALGPSLGCNTNEDAVPGTKVVLVSWMMEYDFWRAEARRAGAVDLERLRGEGKFAFVDGLGMFRRSYAKDEEEEKNIQKSGIETSEKMPARPLPTAHLRGPPGRLTTLPTRHPPSPTPTAADQKSRGSDMHPTTKASTTPGLHKIEKPTPSAIEASVQAALAHVCPPNTANRVLLILDNPDLLLATIPEINPSTLNNLILALHTDPRISHIIAHIQADNPLLAPSTPPQPLEIAHRNLLVHVAHMSRMVLSVRVLDTGVARDVSGVLRITRRRYDDDLIWGSGKHNIEKAEREGDDVEVLYKIGGDGSVRVFERGAGGDG